MKHYLSLIRPTFHIAFIQPVIGYFLYTQNLNLVYFTGIFLIFGLMLYGGLYILNDLFDLELDRKNPLKKNQPIISGKVKPINALILALFFIILSLILTVVLYPEFFGISLFFIIINIAYSWKLKHVPVIDILSNATTHPARLYMGFMAAGHNEFNILLIAWYILHLFTGTLRRQRDKLENKEDSRPVVRHYKKWYFPIAYLIYTAAFLSTTLFMDKTQLIFIFPFFLLGVGFTFFYRTRVVRNLSNMLRF